MPDPLLERMLNAVDTGADKVLGLHIILSGGVLIIGKYISKETFRVHAANQRQESPGDLFHTLQQRYGAEIESFSPPSAGKANYITLVDVQLFLTPNDGIDLQEIRINLDQIAAWSLPTDFVIPPTHHQT